MMSEREREMLRESGTEREIDERERGSDRRWASTDKAGGRRCDFRPIMGGSLSEAISNGL
jgi:hypothetical protein